MKTIVKEFGWQYKSADPSHLNKHNSLEGQINEWLKINPEYKATRVTTLIYPQHESEAKMSYGGYYDVAGRVLVIFEKYDS